MSQKSECPNPKKNENDPNCGKTIFTNAGVQRVLERVIFSVFIFLLYFLYKTLNLYFRDLGTPNFVDIDVYIDVANINNIPV